MPKRQIEDKLIQRYIKKIKKLENKKQQSSRRGRVIVYSDSESESEVERNEEIVTSINDDTVDVIPLAYDNIIEKSPDNVFMPADDIEALPSTSTLQANEIEIPPQITTDEISELDPEIRLALGDSVEDAPVFGENIHIDISQRWLPILRKGLTKEVKDKLLKQHNVPDNCRLLKAPSLNLEISAAVSDVVRTRDKKIEARQCQLGQGISAISKGMSTLISDGNKVEAIKYLSEGCRMLCDLHFIETQTRTKLITPCLDKSFLSVIQDEERDDTLFGNKLSEKIKAAKAIEKQGLQIKRSAPIMIKSVSQAQIGKSRQPGNWTNPPRYPSSVNRGGRGGVYNSSRAASTAHYKRFHSVSSAPPAPPQTRQQTAIKQRAPMRN